jgi:hypothetical protein
VGEKSVAGDDVALPSSLEVHRRRLCEVDVPESVVERNRVRERLAGCNSAADVDTGWRASQEVSRRDMGPSHTPPVSLARVGRS